MVFAVLTLLAHGPVVAAWLAALSACVVFGIAAGAPSSGAGGEGADPASGGAGDGDPADQGDGPGDGTDDQQHGDDPDDPADERQAQGDDDDDDADLPEEIRNDPKRLRTRLRRTQRQFGAVRPIADRFRDANGRFLPPQEIDRVIGRAQDMAELEQFFDQHPDITQQILERRRRGGQPAAAAAADEQFQDPFADPKFKAEWDESTPSGRQFLELFRDRAREAWQLRRDLKAVQQTLTQLTQRDTTRTVAGIETTWKNATLAAAAQVPEVSRRTFVNAVYRAFELAKTRGQLGKVNVQRLIETELEPYVRANRGRQRQTVAGQQQRAERNTTLPRPGRGTTTAAAATESNRVGTIRDARKSFFDRLGMSTGR